MGQKKNVKKKLEIRQRRIFSEEFKRQKVQQLIDKQIGIMELVDLYGISKMTAYRWLYKYSPHYQKGTIQVVQMESEAEKTRRLQTQLAELERVVGQKQMYIDYLEKLIELAAESLRVDIKKNFDPQRSNTSESTDKNTPGK